MRQNKPLDLGGQGKKRWSVDIIINSFDGNGMSFHKVFFNADEVSEAKKIILRETQKIWRRFQRKDDKFMLVTGAPYMPRKGPGVLDGRKLIRLRDRYVSGTRILHIRNPEVPFVVGYGPKVAPKLNL